MHPLLQLQRPNRWAFLKRLAVRTAPVASAMVAKLQKRARVVPVHRPDLDTRLADHVYYRSRLAIRHPRPTPRSRRPLPKLPLRHFRHRLRREMPRVRSRTQLNRATNRGFALLVRLLNQHPNSRMPHAKNRFGPKLREFARPRCERRNDIVLVIVCALIVVGFVALLGSWP